MKPLDVYIHYMHMHIPVVCRNMKKEYMENPVLPL